MVSTRSSSAVADCAGGSGDAELLTVLAGEHRGYVLPPGLRELADRFVYAVLGLLFPHFAARAYAGPEQLAGELSALGEILDGPVGEVALAEGAGARGSVVKHLCSRLGLLREALLRDAAASYEGDPAAHSVDEVILAYPGFLATATYRIAHDLHGRAALFPRLLTEVAHRATGIDIHPGARIGESFAIDHGTGIVIGATAVLGARVRLYQGVTLGALSPQRDDGALFRHKKRHPTIANNVTIYAGATILGDTVIGEGSIIGGNVWLVESVPPRSKVTYQARINHSRSDSAA